MLYMSLGLIIDKAMLFYVKIQ